MLSPKDKIELALRAGLVASSVLRLQGVSSKSVAKLTLCDVIAQIRELDGQIDNMPED